MTVLALNQAAQVENLGRRSFPSVSGLFPLCYGRGDALDGSSARCATARRSYAGGMQHAEEPAPETGLPGVRLGLPEGGPGSIAGWGRRIGALFLDWFGASLLVLLIMRDTSAWTPGSLLQLLPLAAWVLMVTVSTGLTGASPAQHALNLRVIRLDRRPVGLWNGLIRTLLIALVIPPLVADRDRRGLHDLAVGTAVVNGPREQRTSPQR